MSMPTASPTDRDPDRPYALYAELPGWQKDAMERARAKGGYRSKRAWLEATLTKTLTRYRNGNV